MFLATGLGVRPDACLRHAPYRKDSSIMEWRVYT